MSAGAFTDLKAAAGLYGVRVQRKPNVPDVLLLSCPKCGRTAEVMEQSDSEGKGSGELVLWCACNPRWERTSPAELKRQWERQGRRPVGEAESEGVTRYARTDAGNAERFRDLYGNLVRYVHQLEAWRVWTGKRWADDVLGRTEQLALLVARDRLLAAAAMPDDYGRREEARWALASESVRKRRDLLLAASTMPELACLPSDFDTDPFLLDCENGVLDLRTGELRRHDPAAMCSKAVPVAYDPEADCPRWKRFLSEVFGGSEELAGFVQRAVGYSLTGDTREHCLFLLHGTGCNGKSVFLRTLLAMVGEYGANADFATLTLERERQAAIRNDLARLAGGRLVTASETSEGVRFSEGVLKSLTGGDRVTARYLYREFFEFTPTFKLWVACNHRPRVRDSSEAFWRRIRLIPFTVSFKGKEEKGLAEALAAELPGILAWAVRGCLAWQEAGDLVAPREVLAATDAYRADEDQLERFIADCCIRKADATSGATDLYHSYQDWARNGGEPIESQTGFGRRLAEKGFAKGEHPVTRRVVYHGIGLVNGESEA
jgi:putative DNA primase/helicase